MFFFSFLELAWEDTFTKHTLDVCFLNFLFLVDKSICNVCIFKKKVSSEHEVMVFYLEDTQMVKISN